jgi:hypothetical protein
VCGVAFPNYITFLFLPKKKIVVTLIQNNSVALGLSVKIIKYMDSQIFGFSVLLVFTVWLPKIQLHSMSFLRAWLAVPFGGNSRWAGVTITKFFTN